MRLVFFNYKKNLQIFERASANSRTHAPWSGNGGVLTNCANELAWKKHGQIIIRYTTWTNKCGHPTLLRHYLRWESLHIILTLEKMVPTTCLLAWSTRYNWKSSGGLLGCHLAIFGGNQVKLFFGSIWGIGNPYGGVWDRLETWKISLDHPGFEPRPLCQVSLGTEFTFGDVSCM